MNSKDVPCELVEEILLQLPVNSLLRFKCVSKSWLSLISDHKFIKSHLLKSTRPKSQAENYTDQTSPSSPEYTHVMLSSVAATAATVSDKNDETETVHVKTLVEENPEVTSAGINDIKILGSCNGLLCLLLDSSRIIIYNPSTRHVHHVPTLPVLPAKEYFYGFGYDSRSDDFKITRATSSGTNGDFLTELDIFTLRTNRWRVKATTLPFYFMSSAVGTLLNGALHWTVRMGNGTTSPDAGGNDDHDARPFGIVSFDLMEETYRQVPLPCDGDKHFSYYGLGVLGGCLSMIHSPSGSDYQVWTMKEYGVKASWSVLTTIPQKMADSNQYVGLMSLLCILKTGEILMVLKNHNKVVIYNPGKRDFRTIFNGKIGSCQVALYLETLVSPKMYAPIQPTINYPASISLLVN